MNMNRHIANSKDMQPNVDLSSILKTRLPLSLVIWFRLIVTAACASPNNPDVSLSSGMVEHNDINFRSLYSYIDSVNLTTNEEQSFEEVNNNIDGKRDNEVGKESDPSGELQNSTRVQNSLTRCSSDENLDDKQGSNTIKFTGTKNVGIVYYIAKKLSQEVQSKKFISLCDYQLDKYNVCQSAILELYVKLAQHIKRCKNSERIDLALYDKLLYQLHCLHEFKVGLKRIKNLKTRALVEASFINEYEHSFVLDGTLYRFLPEDTILKQEIETIFANRKKQ